MTVDIHTHFFRSPEHFSASFRDQLQGARSGIDLNVRWEEYRSTAAGCSKTVVFGGKAKLSGLWVPDKEVRDYVNQNAESLVGFLSVDG